MHKAEALRSIRCELLEYVQKRVLVEYDDRIHIPVRFILDGKPHDVADILAQFEAEYRRRILSFLIRTTDGEVFFLYFQSVEDGCGLFSPGFWVLSFRIIGDRDLMALYREDRKMLMNMTFKRAVDFHGHLCPELVIGAKVCEYIEKFLSKNDAAKHGMWIIAENCTSAIDAIQILTGLTLGNQRLQVLDFGKHNYTIGFRKDNRGIKLFFRFQHYGDEAEYGMLEDKISGDRITLDEVVRFQELLDARVEHMLGLPPEELFSIEAVGSIQPYTEAAAVYLTCCRCGQQVLKSRVIDSNGATWCIPCFQQQKSVCTNLRVH